MFGWTRFESVSFLNHVYWFWSTTNLAHIKACIETPESHAKASPTFMIPVTDFHFVKPSLIKHVSFVIDSVTPWMNNG